MSGVIVNGFQDMVQFPVLENIINSEKFDNMIFIGTEEHIRLNYPHVIFLHHGYLNFGNYGDAFYETEPLDEKTVYEYTECENIVLKMFDRLEFWVEFDYEYRKQTYLRHLRYWLSIIKKYNIEYYIGSNNPHEIYDYVIFSILQKRNAKMFFFTMELDFVTRTFLEKDFYNYVRFREFLENFGSVDSYPKEIVEFVENKAASVKKFKKPFYMLTKKEQRGTLKNQFKIMKEYNKKIAGFPDYEKRFFYVALHYQPEETTSPRAGVYVDQNLIIEALDFYLPRDIFIYVKEHPKQTVVSRKISFYKDFNHSNRIKFIKTDVSSQELIDNSLAVVTCTGTVGIESVIRGKPVLLFGNVFYQFCPGVFPCKDNLEIQTAITKILNSDYNLNKKLILDFLSKFYEYSFDACLNPEYLKDLSISISMDDNNKKLIKIIEREILEKI